MGPTKKKFLENQAKSKRKRTNKPITVTVKCCLFANKKLHDLKKIAIYVYNKKNTTRSKFVNLTFALSINYLKMDFSFCCFFGSNFPQFFSFLFFYVLKYFFVVLCVFYKCGRFSNFLKIRALIFIRLVMKRKWF